jgi:enoyl-CoA hydratase
MCAAWTSDEELDGVVVARFGTEPMGYFTGEAGAELHTMLRGWRDPAVRVVILTGDRPDRFITHYDVDEILGLCQSPARASARGAGLAERFQDLLQEIADLDKPVIAAITGDAMGGGLELALACDIRVASTGDFRIGFPEVALGILAGGGGTQRLSRLIGAGAAMDFLLRAKVVAPSEALRLGIVHELADDSLGRALEIAAGLLRMPAPALAQTKRAVARGSELPLAAALRLEAEAWLEAVASGTAAGPMEDFLAQPIDRRRAWIERHVAGGDG